MAAGASVHDMPFIGPFSGPLIGAVRHLVHELDGLHRESTGQALS